MDSRGYIKVLEQSFLDQYPEVFSYHMRSSSIELGALFFAAYDTSKATLSSLELGIPTPIIHMISASIGEVV